MPRTRSPTALAQPVRDKHGRVASHDNVVVRLWRRQLGSVQKLFRKINQTAYLFSIPFIMILLLGALVQHRSTAVLGATGVVLLNIGRIAAGVANLAVVPFRDGINLNKMKKPFWRVIEPAITIVVVVVAFTFIPWLSAGASGKGTVAERIRSGADALEKDIRGQVDNVADKAKGLDIEKFGAAAQEKFKGLGSKTGDGRQDDQDQWRNSVVGVGD